MMHGQKNIKLLDMVVTGSRTLMSDIGTGHYNLCLCSSKFIKLMLTLDANVTSLNKVAALDNKYGCTETRASQ
jgi:hypothetical protein